jgi:hypothetical protein
MLPSQWRKASKSLDPLALSGIPTVILMKTSPPQAPDYGEIGSKLGINYKAATGRFYKLRKYFENLEKAGDTNQKEKQEHSDTVTKTESGIKADDPELKEDDSGEDV